MASMATLWLPYGNPMGRARKKRHWLTKFPDLRCVAVVAVFFGIIDNAKINCNNRNATVSSLFPEKVDIFREIVDMAQKKAYIKFKQIHRLFKNRKKFVIFLSRPF